MSRSNGTKSLEPAAREIAAEWGVELGAPFPLARHAFVAPAGEDAVLKVTPALDEEADHEPFALNAWDGRGAAKLLRYEPERRAILIERAKPGTDLSELPDEEAAAIAVGVATSLWQPAKDPYRWIGDYVPMWLDEAEHTGEYDESLMGVAREIYPGMEVGRKTLIHGDLHHHNILDAGDGRYIAIDPKPMCGDPEFDVAPFLWNPIGHLMSRKSAESWLEAFEKAGLDQKRMRSWAVVRGAYLNVDPGGAALLLHLL